MNHVHRCAFCDQDYPGTTWMEEIREDEYACTCPSKDECPGCSEHGACEDCGVKSAGSEINQFLCQECAERWLDNYDPPDRDHSGPTLGEQHAHQAGERWKTR